MLQTPLSANRAETIMTKSVLPWITTGRTLMAVAVSEVQTFHMDSCAHCLSAVPGLRRPL
jgi:hypothetical protein